MNDSPLLKDEVRHAFNFTGKGIDYFLLILVNLFFTVITLGIYMPWALVKCRRYIYSHMELNGKPFSFNMTGGAVFVSFLFLMGSIYIALGFFLAHWALIGIITFLALFLFLPILFLKGFQNQARMTSLNGVRFGFSGSAKGALWNFMGLPFIMMLGLVVALGLLFFIVNAIAGLENIAFTIIFFAVVSFIVQGALYGVLYNKWMNYIGNAGHFGIHRFAISVPMKPCINGVLLTQLIAIPFMVVAICLMFPMIEQVMTASSMGMLDETVIEEISAENSGRQLAVNFVQYLGIIVSGCYLGAIVRKLFLNNLTLGNNTLRFNSSVTGSGLTIRVLILSVGSILTLGIAYPWLKIHLVSWLARNTQVIGNLDALELTNDEQPEPKGALAYLTRGMMPFTPFI